MRFTIFVRPVSACICALSLVGAPSAAPPDVPSVARPSGVAVVELFTSEGCSSCPPADRLLVDLAAGAARDGRPIFTLSFHVDYWNDLGWADPFSRPAFTERQRAYAQALGGGVYTPEMIVNGTTAFVGSDRARAQRAVQAALARPAVARFTRLEAAGGQGNVRVTFAVAGARAGSLINLAFVQPDTAVPVGRGENGGRTLTHHNVMRAFATERLDAAGSGDGQLAVPAGARAGSWRVIAYAQDPESLAILGAGETGIRFGQ
jgi:hypothetical protein